MRNVNASVVLMNQDQFFNYINSAGQKIVDDIKTHFSH